MSKKIATADELIWLFHEKLAGTPLRNAAIAIFQSVTATDPRSGTPPNAGTMLIANREAAPC